MAEIERAQHMTCSWLSYPDSSQDCSLLVDVDSNMADVRQALMFNLPVVSRLMCTLAPINLQSLQTLLQRTKYDDYWKPLTLNSPAIEVMLPPAHPHPILDSDDDDEGDFIMQGDSDEDDDGNDAPDSTQKFSSFAPFVGDEGDLDPFPLVDMSMPSMFYSSDDFTLSSTPSPASIDSNQTVKITTPSNTETANEGEHDHVVHPNML